VGEPAIKVEGIGKRYRLGHGHVYDGRVSHLVQGLIRAPLRLLPGRSGARPEREEFWALRDVSLELPKGHMLGLIGANGAGKSTLLKLLARVTIPTEGRITLRGQVGSLLEVGTGFHPELTGRENVFLNGAILGMARRDIAASFDEIVEFSGIEQFIDTPVKRYSSGMFVRLAFSVAAHLQPEILLVDEVLAVGDADFQRKCLKKLEDVREKEGRTIVFVSHGLQSVRKLCDRVVLIEQGRVKADGPADQVVADYMDRVSPAQHGGVSVIPPETDRTGVGEAWIRKVSLLDDNGDPIESVLYGQPFTIALEVEAEKELPVVFVVDVNSGDGTRVLRASSSDGDNPEQRLEAGVSEVRARFDVTLLPGEFTLDLGVSDVGGTTYDYVERVMSFTARNLPREGSDEYYPWQTVVGYVRPDTAWTQAKPAPAKTTAPSRTAP
jgi:lipopolysaccharide transport system ATP-binding protein